MKNKTDEEFSKIKEFLKERKFNLNNTDFEEDLMSKIILEKNYKIRVRYFIKKSLIFFISGVTSCIILILLLFINNYSTNTSYEVISVICLFSLSVFGILVIDNFLKLLRNYKALN